MPKQIQEGIFDNFFIKIGADSVWKNYEKQYNRYVASRDKCQTNTDKDKLKECQFIVDLKLIMLKINSLRRASSYCKNTKDPNKCRQRIGKIIKRANKLMILKRDALKKLHDKMNEEMQKNMKIRVI